MATLADLEARLDQRVNRTDADYTTNRTFFLNEGLRWLQDQLDAAETFVRLWHQADHQPLALPANEWSFDLPADWRPSKRAGLYRISGSFTGASAVAPFYSGSLVELKRVPEEWAFLNPTVDVTEGEELDLSATLTPGTPRVFLLRGRRLEVRPHADAAYSLVLVGGFYLPALAAAPDSNILTIEAPEACLYAGAAAAWQFFEDMGRSEFWFARAAARLEDWRRARRSSESLARPLVMETPG